MTKLLILSDLHNRFFGLSTEFEGQRIDRDADIVVLAGDIDEFHNGLQWARNSFPDKEVVYVAGNHEFYSGHWEQTLDEMRKAAQTLGIHFLENDAITLQGVRFLGCTMWTDYELFAKQDTSVRAECMQVAQKEFE